LGENEGYQRTGHKYPVSVLDSTYQYGCGCVKNVIETLGSDFTQGVKNREDFLGLL
jgi:hypothetical protein